MKMFKRRLFADNYTSYSAALDGDHCKLQNFIKAQFGETTSGELKILLKGLLCYYNIIIFFSRSCKIVFFLDFSTDIFKTICHK